MAEGKRHILLPDLGQKIAFVPKGGGRSKALPTRGRAEHGERLLGRLGTAYAEGGQREAAEPLEDETKGVYLELTSFDDSTLPLDKLDNTNFNLQSIHSIEGGEEVAVVFVSDSKREAFTKKISEYLDAERDTSSGNPRNRPLVDAIKDIRLADLASFWTDNPGMYPDDPDRKCWWEIWLKSVREDQLEEKIEALCNSLNIRSGLTSYAFHDSAVFTVYACANELAGSLDLISSLAELRKPADTPFDIISCSPREQQEWSDELLERLTIDPESEHAVVVLDAGINYDHTILNRITSDALSTRWDPAWPKYDSYNPLGLGPYNDHGSRMAGVVAFSNLLEHLPAAEEVVVPFVIESGRIIPPIGANDSDLWGSITVGTASKLEIDRPDLSRTYAMAVTAPEIDSGGQPTSWSCTIDHFSGGFQDGTQRLFIISAGNNNQVQPNPDHFDQVQLAQVQDPGQSWNAITVGGYTEKSVVNDPVFKDWSPLADPGDIAPMSTSSTNWAWRKHAPIKPDLVDEGGNYLISDDKTEISNADCVSQLTTSGRSDAVAFETFNGTSAASAMVANKAGTLAATYPELWPETVRGLLIHSASWTPKMIERFDQLRNVETERDAKEAMLRSFGFGVPDLDIALNSASNLLTMVVEDHIQPFQIAPDATPSTDPKLFEMAVHGLPWPRDSLIALGDAEVECKITLSYFVEPYAGRRGYRDRYSYQSHALRFDMKNPEQPVENFLAKINKLEETDDYEGPEGTNEGWLFGRDLRTLGSVHCDVWRGPAVNLAAMDHIAVYPVGGWWKYRTARDRANAQVRYALIASINAAEHDIDIYSEVEQLVTVTQEVDVEV